MAAGYICPVCEYPHLSEPPRSEFGGGSFEICPSCGFQFGVNDDDEGISYETWRRRWEAAGMPWSSVALKPPAAWKPVARHVAPGGAALRRPSPVAAADESPPASPSPRPPEPAAPAPAPASGKAKAGPNAPAKPAAQKAAGKPAAAKPTPVKKAAAGKPAPAKKAAGKKPPATKATATKATAKPARRR
jgi:hypothetical protein